MATKPIPRPRPRPEPEPKPEPGSLLDNCPTCYEVILNECADFILIAGGFKTGETYIIIITDKFGNEYRLTYVSDDDGSLTIDVTDLPDGLFTAYSGVFTVKIYESDGCTPATITFCEEVYTCLKLTFKTVLLESDDDIFEYIKCCEEEPVSGITLSVTQECVKTEIGLLSFIVSNISLVETNGSYEVQQLFGTDWITVFTQSGLPPTIDTIASLQSDSETLNSYRVTSGDVISNVVQFQLSPCQ